MAAGDRLVVHEDDTGLRVRLLQHGGQRQRLVPASGVGDADGPAAQQLGVGGEVIAFVW